MLTASGDRMRWRSGWQRAARGGALASRYMQETLRISTLAAYWPLNEGSGITSARDWSPNAKTGTHSGSLTVGAELIPGTGASRSFPGSSGVSTACGLATNATDNFTLELWCRPTLPHGSGGVNGGMLVMNGLNTNGYGIGIGTGVFAIGSKLTMLFGGIDFYDTGYTMPTSGALYHLVMVRNSGTAQMYVNGAATGNSRTTTPGTPTTETRIGGYSDPGYEALGTIGHVAIYTSALSATVIAYRYALGLTG